MKLPLSWLSDYVDINDVDHKKIAEKLVHIGFEVEDIIDTGIEISNVITGKIMSIEPHPDADKLCVCKINIGENTLLQVVTGAKNIKKNDVVPVAIDGAALPNMKRIYKNPLRGIMSEGMLCSGSELNVDDSVISGASVDGILVLPPSTKLGLDIKTVLGLDEIILDINVTANRPDCQSVYGMAREIGAMLGKPVKPLNLSYKVKPTTQAVLQVEIEDKLLCSRYTGRVIENIKIAESPNWMKKRLRLLGLKPINNIVDITNYVLMETGQPLHAFDIRMIEEKIVVRRAKRNETIKLLTGSEHTLTESMLLIADKVKPLALAGVMGGEYSGISSDTKAVFLEAARFARGSIRTTSRVLGIKSDSSTRYEKGVDYESIDTGRERALALFCELNAGEILDIVSENSVPRPKEKVIKTSAAQISGLLGIKISEKQIIEILSALNIRIVSKEQKLSCLIPLYREDIDGYPDLAEEVIRFYGYDKLKSTMFSSGKTSVGGYSERDRQVQAIKTLMTGFGAHEIITYSFINKKQYDKLNVPEGDGLRNVIEILNPLTEDYAVMRTELSGGMLNAVRLNVSRKNENFRLFETAKVYRTEKGTLKKLPQENETLCIAFVGKGEDFYLLKTVINELFAFFKIEIKLEYTDCPWLHPGIGAKIITTDGVIGNFGKIHPVAAKNFDVPESLYLAEICIESLLSHSRCNAIYKNLPKFPAVDRDLAITVKDEIMIGDLTECIQTTAAGLCERIDLFDVYKGAQIKSGYKSVAFSIRLRAAEKTLTDADIQGVIGNIIKMLQKQFQAQLRA